MWKIVAFSALILFAAIASPFGGATAQAPQPTTPSTQPPAAAPPPAASKPAKTASPRKRKTRQAWYRHKRRHTAALKCFGYQWRPFPTRDPTGYFYTPPGGGIC